MGKLFAVVLALFAFNVNALEVEGVTVDGKQIHTGETDQFYDSFYDINGDRNLEGVRQDRRQADEAERRIRQEQEREADIERQHEYEEFWGYGQPEGHPIGYGGGPITYDGGGPISYDGGPIYYDPVHGSE